MKDPRVVQRATTEFVPVLMDLKSAGEIGRKHGISSTPTIAFVDPADDEVFAWVEGSRSADEVLAGMDAALEDLAEIREALKEHDEGSE
jgi:hypothetical protein